MKKKYIKYIAALPMLIMLTQACTKLDKNVYSNATDSNFPKTPAQVSAVIASAYNAMTSLPCGNTFQLNEVSSDEMIVPTRGNDWYDGGAWQSYWTHNFRSDNNADIQNAWPDLSGGVTKCNFVLSIINGLPTKPANVDATIAEVKVLRAYYLFMFMDLYGNIPLVTDYKTDPTKVVQSTRSAVYAFIESELTTNVPLLSANGQGKDNTVYGHINRWGGYMLLAKLYLNAQVYTGTPQWAKAAAAADMVIKSGQYSLQPNMLDNFAVNNDASVENIFVVPYDNTYIHGNSIELFTLNYANNLTYGLTGQPYNGFCSPTPFFKSFTDIDARKKMWEIGQQYSASGDILVDPKTGLKTILSPYVLELSNPADSFRNAGARSIKYYPQAGTFGDVSNDGVIFRLGDAYLMKAEAALRAGAPDDALSLVNDIRTRSGVPTWGMSDLTMPNLLAERGRELAWEGWRRNDLIRFEVADGIKYFTGARVPGKTQDADTHTFIYPIPSPQILTNPNLKQNPGYVTY
ncbi:MAG: RagB/SusD family nutrient uptake outer membrane protein [Mucilaginibacter sp.]|nr:RagB/SusD family nutrient uptake outer membrane protein [Mucilaginibacter sp.]